MLDFLIILSLESIFITAEAVSSGHYMASCLAFLLFLPHLVIIEIENFLYQLG